MVCTANDLQGWKDFPKGLRVLLLQGDNNSASEIRAKLESMDYNVSTFYNENEALSAISSSSKDFHVAVVEVSISCPHGGFKFLENAKDLPTIMTSNSRCINTMMKCIALGAVEFLTKPLSEDKLKNIWQHVVHKAFNAESSAMSESLKPVKESVESMLQLETDNKLHESTILIDLENVSKSSDDEHEHSAASDKYPAPSTPQLKQGARLVDDGDCHEQTNCSIEKESGEHDGGECKFVETSCENVNAESSPQPTKPLIKEEDDFANGSKGESSVLTNPQSKKLLGDTGVNASPNETSGPKDSCEIKANRKKMKVDWTPELHKKFVKAVEQLGIDQAIPSRILELMKVEGLTRHNVASHLQKYRMHKRQIMHTDEDKKWPKQRDTMQRNYCMQRPIMAYPPYHSNHTYPPAPVYPMWGQPGSQTAGVPIWAPPGYPLWQQPTESWHWNPYPGVHVDAWGNPMLPLPQPPCVPYTQNITGLHNAKAVDYRFGMPQNSFDHYPAEEMVDKVVKEAITKPWLPLPIGLKPPSMDSVLDELTKQGIPFSKSKASKH
ncbi:two-component response regulator APRR2-like protein [Trifolium pratense]|uniref:Two-component response regulator APRR2-like protein n=2 Tax=Trifolium pratense TaxID=57577 RepID=A0A2K3PF46_TRIPR|nr:two-component response regulator-like APRR2 [Trifolium pratense]XP_045812107.1 two-component response regulator-like APRR2 [Trifolium pratense]PNY13916.1 two-component response regulator APRR2-like protein [Trifolium pratense]